MAQASKPKPDILQPAVTRIVRGLREGASMLLVALAIYLLVSLFSFDAGDPGWSSTGQHSRIINAGGRLGAWFADVALYLLGYVAT